MPKKIMIILMSIITVALTMMILSMAIDAETIRSIAREVFGVTNPDDLRVTPAVFKTAALIFSMVTIATTVFAIVANNIKS